MTLVKATSEFHCIDSAIQRIDPIISVHYLLHAGREALSYIANEKIRDELAKSVVFVSAVQLHKIKPLLVVLQHKIFRFNSRQLELRSGLLKGDKAIDFRNVFNIEELRRKIVSYIWTRFMRERTFSTMYAICLHYPYPTLTSILSSPLPYTYYDLTATLIPSVTILKTPLTITMYTLTLHIKRWKKRTIQ